MFKVSEGVALWSIIQAKDVVQHIPGCTQAGLGSLCAWVEHWTAVGQEAVEDTLDGQG